jgi:hypothetical protein
VADPTIVDQLRDELIAAGIGRAPDQAGALPPIWRHEDDGPVGPGDAEEAGRPAATWDDGIVITLMYAPGFPPVAGAEERQQEVVDIHVRSTAVAPAFGIYYQVRRLLLGDPPFPGGRTDWTMQGRYIIQSIESKPWQPGAPGSAPPGQFAFFVGYLFETRVD